MTEIIVTANFEIVEGFDEVRFRADITAALMQVAKNHVAELEADIEIPLCVSVIEVVEVCACGYPKKKHHFYTQACPNGAQYPGWLSGMYFTPC